MTCKQLCHQQTSTTSTTIYRLNTNGTLNARLSNFTHLTKPIHQHIDCELG